MLWKAQGGGQTSLWQQAGARPRLCASSVRVDRALLDSAASSPSQGPRMGTPSRQTPRLESECWHLSCLFVPGLPLGPTLPSAVFLKVKSLLSPCNVTSALHHH